MENAGYFFAVAAIVWAVIFGYVLYVMGKQKKLSQEINSLTQMIKSKHSAKTN